MLTPILANANTQRVDSPRSQMISSRVMEWVCLGPQDSERTNPPTVRDNTHQRELSAEQQLRAIRGDAANSCHGTRSSSPGAGNLSLVELPTWNVRMNSDASESQTNLIPFPSREAEGQPASDSVCELLLHHRGNSPNQPSLEPEQLKTFLYNYYCNSRWMRRILGLICAQLFVSIGFFILMVVVADLAFVGLFYCLPQTVFISPLNCACLLVVDLCLDRKKILQKELFSFPLFCWALVISEAIPPLLVISSVDAWIVFTSGLAIPGGTLVAICLALGLYCLRQSAEHHSTLLTGNFLYILSSVEAI